MCIYYYTADVTVMNEQMGFLQGSYNQKTLDIEGNDTGDICTFFAKIIKLCNFSGRLLSSTLTARTVCSAPILVLDQC